MTRNGSGDDDDIVSCALGVDSPGRLSGHAGAERVRRVPQHAEVSASAGCGRQRRKGLYSHVSKHYLIRRGRGESKFKIFNSCIQGQFANIFNQAVLEINPNHAIIKVSRCSCCLYGFLNA